MRTDQALNQVYIAPNQMNNAVTEVAGSPHSGSYASVDARALVRVGRRSTIGMWILAAYLGLAPVYWLPGVGPPIMSSVKMALIASAVGLIWTGSMLRGRRFTAPGIVGPWGLVVLLVVAAPGFFQAENLSIVVDSFVDLIIGFFVLWTCYTLSHSGVDVVRPLLLSSMMIAVFSLPPLIEWLTGFPGLINPWGFPLSFGGFGGRRTGWSAALCLYLAPAIIIPAFLAFSASSRLKGVLVALAAAVAIVGSQLGTGGRGGLLASLLVLIILLMLLAPRQYAYAILGIIVVAAVLTSDLLFEHLRFDKLASLDFESLDEFSAYRLGTYSRAVDKVVENPLVGYGFDAPLSFRTRYGPTSVHNTWLQLALQAGILLPLTFLVMMVLILRSIVGSIGRDYFRAIRARVALDPIEYRDTLILTSSALTVLAGLVVSQLEPNALIGSFQNEVQWWAAVGIAMGIVWRRRELAVLQQLAWDEARLSDNKRKTTPGEHNNRSF